MIKSKKLLYFVSFFAIVELALLCYSFIFNYGCMDHAEHLHASWLIWQGKIPYRDFFEHHNPLLWYVLSPLVGFFYKNAIILYISRLISCLAYFSLFFVIYKISNKFFKMSKIAFLLALVIFYSIPDSYFLLYELHPDSFMLLSYFTGFYYYCQYLEEKKQKYLNISFILFAISFLFLQKILVVIFYTGIFTLYLIYSKKVTLKPILLASIAPILIISLCAIYFYLTDTLSIYLKLNYELNFIMQKFLGKGKVFGGFFYSAYLPIVSLLTVKYFLSDNNIYKKMLIFIVIMEYITKYITGAPYRQYFVFNNIISVLIIANYIVNNISLKRVKFLLCLIFIISCYLFYREPFNKRYPAYYLTNKIIYSAIEKDDALISTIHYINIYGKDVSYYWFGLGNIAPVTYYIYNYAEPFLLNDAILKHKPKFIFNNRYNNEIIHNSMYNNSTVEEYISNLYKIYDEMPVKIETRNEFVKRWSSLEFSVYNKELIKYNYIMHPYLPIFIRKDLVDTKNK